jgi:hypothetical protein
VLFGPVYYVFLLWCCDFSVLKAVQASVCLVSIFDFVNISIEIHSCLNQLLMLTLSEIFGVCLVDVFFSLLLTLLCSLINMVNWIFGLDSSAWSPMKLLLLFFLVHWLRRRRCLYSELALAKIWVTEELDPLPVHEFSQGPIFLYSTLVLLQKWQRKHIGVITCCDKLWAYFRALSVRVTMILCVYGNAQVTL